MSDDKLVKKVHCELKHLNSQGFTNWTIDAMKLVNDLDFYFTEDKTFIDTCKRVVKNNFVSTWFTNLRDLPLSPSLRTYRTIQFDYSMEPYLYLAKKHNTVIQLRNCYC